MKFISGDNTYINGVCAIWGYNLMYLSMHLITAANMCKRCSFIHLNLSTEIIQYKNCAQCFLSCDQIIMFAWGSSRVSSNYDITLGTKSKFRGNSLSLQCKDSAVYPLSPLALQTNFPFCPATRYIR